MGEGDGAAVSVEWRGIGGVGAATGAAGATAAAAPAPSSSSYSPPLSAAAASSFIRSCVQAALEQGELPPSSSVAVVVRVISGDGSELSCAANAVAAALSDAAVPLRFSFAASTVAMVGIGGGGGGKAEGETEEKETNSVLVLLDPTSSEEASPSSFASATVAFPCASREPGKSPTVDPGSVLAVRCCSRVKDSGEGGSRRGGARGSGSGDGDERVPSSSCGFGTDPECSFLALAVNAAARGAQRVAEFGRMSLEASFGGVAGGGGAGGA